MARIWIRVRPSSWLGRPRSRDWGVYQILDTAARIVSRIWCLTLPVLARDRSDNASVPNRGPKCAWQSSEVYHNCAARQKWTFCSLRCVDVKLKRVAASFTALTGSSYPSQLWLTVRKNSCGPVPVPTLAIPHQFSLYLVKCKQTPLCYRSNVLRSKTNRPASVSAFCGRRLTRQAITGVI